ncbi:MAG: 2-dehydropantoate 2-reductase [Pseudomonadota bacterium]
MRIGIIGVGGVGGHLAVRLALAGHAVQAIARGAHGRAIADGALVLQTPAETVEARLAGAAARAEALGPVDLAVFAVKGQDLDGAMDAATAWMDGGAVALSFLNGVEAPERLVARFGAGRALGGVARISAVIGAPGRVVQTTPGAEYVVGALDPGDPAAAMLPALAEAFAGAGIPLAVTDDVRGALWRKFVSLTALAGITAAARATVGDIAAHPPLRALMRQLVEEAAAVAAAEGVTLAPDTPVDSERWLLALAPTVRASMAHDLAAGKPLELDWLNGAVVRIAARHGVPVPGHAAVTALLTPWRAGPPASATVG